MIFEVILLRDILYHLVCSPAYFVGSLDEKVDRMTEYCTFNLTEYQINVHIVLKIETDHGEDIT